MFLKAKPIYAREGAGEFNFFTVFEAQLPDLHHAVLHITAADFYRVSVNGRFVGFGPARTAKGYARMDVLPLDAYAEGNSHKIEILVAGYNCCTLSTVRQPSFVWAEIVKDGEVLAYTGRDFDCLIPEYKIQKTDRYSMQRHFVEEWDFTKTHCKQAETAELVPAPTVIPRVAPYPHYEDVLCLRTASSGDLVYDETVVPRKSHYSYTPSVELGCFTYDEIQKHSYEWVQMNRQVKTADARELPVTLTQNSYAIFDFGRIETGFIQLLADAEEETELVIAFSEDASAGQFTFTDMQAHNVVDLTLCRGQSCQFMTFEPYVMRYAMVAVKRGHMTLNSFGIKTFVHDTSDVVIPQFDDPILTAVYRGAVRTFSHNAVDIYMDCPSRERAGWLCDSYFTGKVEYELFGSTDVEDAFLENYRLYKNHGEYHAGMIPMCYPSEPKLEKTYIPQWSMWYILEVEDYINNRGHRSEKELFRQSIFDLLAYYKRYENSDGLVEHLPSWNFVEWSRANNWTRDVSYPTNFLYAQVLECVYRLYGDEACLARAEAVRKETVKQSFNGTVFLDHAVRDANGVLQRCDDCSEACQYYAILFGGIDLRSGVYAPLAHLVLQVFSAKRSTLLDEIAPINAFVGLYLRMEVLLKLGEYSLLLRDIREFFGDMEKETGTLWEYRERHGSRDHGFASYALVAIRKAVEELGK